MEVQEVLLLSEQGQQTGARDAGPACGGPSALLSTRQPRLPPDPHGASSTFVSRMERSDEAPGEIWTPFAS